MELTREEAKREEGWLSVSHGSRRERKMARQVRARREAQQGVSFCLVEKKKTLFNTLDSNVVIRDAHTLHISAGEAALFREAPSNSVISHPHMLPTYCTHIDTHVNTQPVSTGDMLAIVLDLYPKTSDLKPYT